MGKELQLALLGNVELRRDGVPVTGFRSGKAQALLCYLAVTGRPHLRPTLAGLLWGELPEASAQNNLRKALTNLRQVVGPYLSITRQAVAFNRDSRYWLDVEVLQAQVGGAAAEAASTRADIERLQGAVELYRGDFLEGFYVRRAQAFEEWVLAQRARLRGLALRALYNLAVYYAGQGQAGHAAGIDYTTRLLALEPWREEAHRQLMLLLARSGQRSAALAQYQTCSQLLAEELGVEPAEETVALFEQIRAGKLEIPIPIRELGISPRPPIFLEEEVEIERPARPVFVAREREIERLNGFLETALASQGRVAFVTGEAGSGKTALVQEFTRRAQERHGDLVVASGKCNAHTGVGDPYLPFRKILGLLTGDVESMWNVGVVSTEQARHLWNLIPHSVQALVSTGPDLVNIFIPGRALIARATVAAPGGARWMAQLEALVAQKEAGLGRGDLSQSDLFEQYTKLLRTLARQEPLLLVLDDLQWADVGTINLLFHLCRRLEGCPILTVGIYRGSEVALGRQGERHPLEQVLSELKRRFGDVWVDLTDADEGESRRFVEAYLDTEPNRLGVQFRQALSAQTAGHPLFTVELLRAMQERGDLAQDQEGRWIERTTLDWGRIPARVEGVIEERISRLDEEQRETLTIASVEGEDFTAQVIAGVQEVPERRLMRELSQELEKRHRLVRERGEERVGGRSLSSYRFAHALFQQYVYNELGAGERRLLHGEVAEVLEALYGDQAEEIAVQLAHHFTQAETWEKAFLHLTRSGDRARRAYANQEAIALYTQALEVSGRITPLVDEAQLLPVYEGRGVVWRLLTRQDEAIADFHMMRQMASASGNQQKEGESLFNLANAHYWKLSAKDIPMQEQYAQEAVRLAQLTGDQKTVARSLTSLALVDQTRGELQEADRKFEESLHISRREGYRDSISENLSWLGAQAGWQGDYKRAEALCKEGSAVAREINNGLGELINLAFLSLAQANLGNYGEALNTIQEGMTKAEERDNKFIASRLPNHLGKIHSLFGDFSRAAEYDQESAELGRTIGNANVEISALINLGADYLGLGQCERARCHLEEVLERIEIGDFGAHEFLWKQRLLNVLAEACRAMGAHEEALRDVEESLSVAVAHSSQKYMAKGWALRGRILAHLGNAEAAAADLQRAFALAEQLNSPSITYPIAYDLGQWYESAGQDREAALLYGKARDAIERMVTSIEDQALQSIFLQSALVQAIKESWDRTR